MNEKILQFPGAPKKTRERKPKTPPAQAVEMEQTTPQRFSPPGDGSLGLPGLTQDQEKAVKMILSGMPFVILGIRPTDTGADFFTAIDGPKQDLRNASGHIPHIIAQALDKAGLTVDERGRPRR
jgi:hypothetical protein